MNIWKFSSKFLILFIHKPREQKIIQPFRKKISLKHQESCTVSNSTFEIFNVFMTRVTSLLAMTEQWLQSRIISEMIYVQSKGLNESEYNFSEKSLP